MSNITTHLEKISSWSYLFGYYKDSLGKLQQEFPSGYDTKPYPKSFFTSLNKVRLAQDSCDRLISYINNDIYGNKTVVARSPKAFKKAEKKRLLAAKNFAIAKLQHTSKTAGIEQELAALTNLWKTSALAKLRTRLKDTNRSYQPMKTYPW